MTHRGWWTLCQNFRSLALTVWKLWWFEDISTKERWLNQSMNYDGVCRTAPATPGLLKILLFTGFLKFAVFRGEITTINFTKDKLLANISLYLDGNVANRKGLKFQGLAQHNNLQMELWSFSPTRQNRFACKGSQALAKLPLTMDNSLTALFNRPGVAGAVLQTPP